MLQCSPPDSPDSSEYREGLSFYFNSWERADRWTHSVFDVPIWMDCKQKLCNSIVQLGVKYPHWLRLIRRLECALKSLWKDCRANQRGATHLPVHSAERPFHYPKSNVVRLPTIEDVDDRRVEGALRQSEIVGGGGGLICHQGLPLSTLGG